MIQNYESLRWSSGWNANTNVAHRYEKIYNVELFNLYGTQQGAIEPILLTHNILMNVLSVDANAAKNC